MTYGSACVPACRRHREPRGGRSLPGSDQRCAFGKIEPAPPDIAALMGGAFTCQRQDRAVARCFLLDQDGVGPFRKRRAGKNARCLPSLDRTAKRPSRRAFADDGPWPRHVLKADRIAVHRRQVVCRLGPACGHVTRGPASGGLAQRQFDDGAFAGQGEQSGLGFGDGEKNDGRSF